MSRKTTRLVYKKFKRYATWPTWRLVFTSLLFFLAGAFFLRSNNITSLELYQEVIKADEHSGNVYEKLDQLQEFTFGHLNSDIGRPVQLVYSYDRDANKIFAEAQAKLNASGDGTQDIYLEAQKACEAKGIPITARAQCAADYAMENNPQIAQEKLEVQLPDKALYSFRFNSPKWTWDMAGICIALGLVLLLGAIIRMWLAWFLRKRWSTLDRKYLS